MKKTGIFLAMVLFFLCKGLAVVNAGTSPGFPEVISIPDVRFLGEDPCASADTKFDLTLVSSQDLGCNVTECTLAVTYSMDVNGTIEAYLVKNYHRVTIDNNDYVTMDDTIIMPGASGGAIFGRSYNGGPGPVGSVGVITGAVFASGMEVDMSGSYLFSSYDDNESLCFWLGPQSQE